MISVTVRQVQHESALRFAGGPSDYGGQSALSKSERLDRCEPYGFPHSTSSCTQIVRLEAL